MKVNSAKNKEESLYYLKFRDGLTDVGLSGLFWLVYILQTYTIQK